MTDRRLNWALVAYPLLVSVWLTSKIELGCLALLLVLSVKDAVVWRAPLRHYVPIGLIVGVCGVLSFPRGAPTHKDYLLLIVPAAAAIMAARRTDRPTALRSLALGMAAYLGANVAGWVIGLQSPAASVRVGLNEGRVIFPFVRSINEPAIVAAALIGYCLVSWRRGQRVGWLTWAGVPFAAVVILESGSRFPALVLAVIVPAVLVWPRVSRWISTAALATSATFPVLFSALTPLVVRAAGAMAGWSFFARNETTATLAEGGSRAIFWNDALTWWGIKPDWLEQWFGYGFDGHYQSGVVFMYYTQDSFVSNAASLSLHNSFLQQMYDTGYVGLASLIVALLVIGRRFSRDLAASTIIGVLYATAAIEIYLDPSFRAIPLMLVLVLAAMAPEGVPDVGGDGATAEPRALPRRARGQSDLVHPFA